VALQSAFGSTFLPSTIAPFPSKSFLFLKLKWGLRIIITSIILALKMIGKEGLSIVPLFVYLDSHFDFSVLFFCCVFIFCTVFLLCLYNISMINNTPILVYFSCLTDDYTKNLGKESRLFSRLLSLIFTRCFWLSLLSYLRGTLAPTTTSPIYSTPNITLTTPVNSGLYMGESE